MINKLFKKHREKLGLTRMDITRSTGIQADQIKKWEENQKDFLLLNVISLLDSIGLQIEIKTDLPVKAVRKKKKNG